MSPPQAMPGRVRDARSNILSSAWIPLLTYAATPEKDLEAVIFNSRARSVTAISLSAPRPTARDGEAALGEWVGVAIALVSSCLGGTAAAITRYLAGNTDPITMAILRWGDRLSLRAAGGAAVEGALAAAPGLARRRRTGLLLLRRVLRALQHRDVLHDGGARQPRAGDAAAAHHGGRRLARHRAADETEIDRRRHRGARRLRSPCIRAFEPRRRARGAAN